MILFQLVFNLNFLLTSLLGTQKHKNKNVKYQKNEPQKGITVLTTPIDFKNIFSDEKFCLKGDDVNLLEEFENEGKHYENIDHGFIFRYRIRSRNYSYCVSKLKNYDVRLDDETINKGEKEKFIFCELIFEIYIQKTIYDSHKSTTTKETKEYPSELYHLQSDLIMRKIQKDKILKFIYKRNKRKKFEMIVRYLKDDNLESKNIIERVLKNVSKSNRWCLHIFYDIMSSIKLEKNNNPQQWYKLTFRLAYKYFSDDSEIDYYSKNDSKIDLETQSLFFYINCNLDLLYENILTNLINFLGLEKDKESQEYWILISKNQNESLKNTSLLKP